MSERMTTINLRGSASPGLGEWGDVSAEEMIRKYRAHAEREKAASEEVLAAGDADFHIEQGRGVHRRRDVRVLQEGRSQ